MILNYFLTQDYITEKYFNILPFNIIPVMLNGANMTNHAPFHSYINAEDFSSTKELAKYLKMVASNDTLFASYFWWRDYYKIVGRVTRSFSFELFCSGPV